MTDPSVTEPVAKRADQLVVGDRVPDEYLPYRFNPGPGEVVFTATEDGDETHTFFAWRYPNGQHESTTVRAAGELMVYPADPSGLTYSRADDDPETTQPIAGRVPAHLEDAVSGEVVVVGGAKPLQFCNGAPVDYAADCGELGPHGPHGPGSVRGAR